MTMSLPVKLLFFQYLTPLVYAVLLYFIHIMPTDGQFGTVLLFLIGFYIGNMIMWLDGAVIYPYYNQLRTEPKQLMTHSVVFGLAYIPVSLFLHTSSGSVLGSGLVFAIGLTIASELFAFRLDDQSFQHRFLFQLKRQLSAQEITRVVWSAIGFMLFTTVLFFF